MRDGSGTRRTLEVNLRYDVVSNWPDGDRRNLVQEAAPSKGGQFSDRVKYALRAESFSERDIAMLERATEQMNLTMDLFDAFAAVRDSWLAEQLDREDDTGESAWFEAQYAALKAFSAMFLQVAAGEIAGKAKNARERERVMELVREAFPGLLPKPGAGRSDTTPAS